MLVFALSESLGGDLTFETLTGRTPVGERTGTYLQRFQMLKRRPTTFDN